MTGENLVSPGLELETYNTGTLIKRNSKPYNRGPLNGQHFSFKMGLDSVGESPGPNFINISAENVAQKISLQSKILLSTSKTQYTPYDTLACNLYLLSKNIMC